jgi:hypothetical protein
MSLRQPQPAVIRANRYRSCLTGHPRGYGNAFLCWVRRRAPPKRGRAIQQGIAKCNPVHPRKFPDSIVLIQGDP